MMRVPRERAVMMPLPDIYHPPTKLWAGNVFTGVCVSIHWVSPQDCYCDHYPWCIGPLDLGPREPPYPTPPAIRQEPCPLLMTSGGHRWRTVQTNCTAPPLGVTSDGCWMSYDQCKRAVHIPLECFLVWILICRMILTVFLNFILHGNIRK